MKHYLTRLTVLCFCLLAFRATATTYYVDINSTNPTPPYTNWSTASKDIQSAVNETTNGDLVLVNPGVYQSGGYTAPDGTLTAVVITNAVTLQSVDGAPATFINGNASVRGLYLQTSSTLAGFTITNCTSSTNSGGGIYCQSSAMVSNCVIIGNTTYVVAQSADQDGPGGGGVVGGTMYNCLIADNAAPNGSGGGALLSVVNNCTIAGNLAANGGGVYQSPLNNCYVTNNTATYEGGGSMSHRDGISMNNCILAHNSAPTGGGAAGFNPACTWLVNCTVADNTASSQGGGIFGEIAENSIIFGNTCSNGANYSNCTLTYCCTTPSLGGTGNITNAPLFVNEAAGDFHLQSNCICINSANNSYVTTTNDLDGNPRIIGGVVDMGALEYQSTIPMTVAIGVDNTNVAEGIPLPIQAIVGQGVATIASWSFGDGTTATNQLSVTHVWNYPGIYTVTVTVSNDYVPQSTSTSAEINVGMATSYVNVNGTDPVAPYSSWDTAATNIQDAIDAMIYYGGTIFVTNGVYQSGGETVNGSSLTNRVVIDKNVTLESVNGPGSTFIFGNLVTSLGYEVYGGSIRCVYMTNNSSLIGFTLANGGTLGYGANANDENGAGVWCASTNNIVISNCVIAANIAYNQGGGAYQGILANCTILKNQAAEGGGAANALVFGSLVVSNVAVAVNNSGGGGAADEGGGAYNSYVFSSAIAENSAANEGGGAYGSTLINCTVTANTALTSGGGVESGAQTNCIIYYNQILSNRTWATNWDSDNEVALDHCCTTPMAYWPGNITNPPALANISHISLNSPCRGAGNPSMTNGVDIDGNPWANPPSIGCSEIPSGGDFGNLIVNISTPFTNWAPGYPLNFQATISGPCYTTVWTFGDGTILTNVPYLSHVWPSVGDYPVTLTAYNDSYPTGVTTTLMITIAVPTTYYVNLANRSPVPPYSYWSIAATNIQDAVAAAAPGSLILVTNNPSLVTDVENPYTNYVSLYKYGGTNFPGQATFNRVAITKPLMVQSVNGPSVTWIMGYVPGVSSGAVRCVYMTNGVVLSGFTITNGFSENGGSPPDLEGGGIWAASTNSIITNCVIVHCEAQSAGGGDYSGTLYNCTFKNNTASTGGGVDMSAANGCLFYTNTSSSGGAAANSVLNNCTLSTNSAGSSGDGGAAFECTLTNCVLTGNYAEQGGAIFAGIACNSLFANNSAQRGGAAYATASYPVVLNNCTISNNNASTGGGVYAISSPNFTNCIVNNCLLTSNSAYFSGGGGYGAQLNNCAISNNYCTEPGDSGGGGVEGGLLNNCVLTGNQCVYGAAADGSAIPCALSNCTLAANVALEAGGANNCTLDHCTLVANAAEFFEGGGAANSILNQCTILQNVATNEGGGVAYCSLNSCLIISNTAFSDPSENLAGEGGGAYNSTLTNCILAYNVSMPDGGGAYGSTLINCTVATNTASLGGGVQNCQANNSIIYYNTGGDVYPYTTAYPLNNCCVSLQATNGIRNITNAPLFVNLAGGDFHLESTSPCINSGNNAYIKSVTDLDGNPRIVGDTVDIGAYEYQTPTSVISYAYLQQYGLPTDGSVDFADLDGTAFNVYQDWIAGLNPTNPASVLAMLTPVTTTNATGVTVTWQSVSGIPYLLQRSTNLASQPPFSTIQNNIIGQSNTTSYTDTSATNNVPYFYRVGVVAP